MTAITADEVLRIAKAVARRYARRSWWADVDDLTSVACAAVLEAALPGKWDPQVGVPFDGYAARAASNQVAAYLWEQSSPVSGGGHDPRKYVAGVHAGPLDGEDAMAACTHRPDPGRELDDINWTLKVRRRIRQIASVSKGGELAIDVLLRGRRPRDVIAEGGDAYSAVNLVRRRMRVDSVSYRLWRTSPRPR